MPADPFYTALPAPTVLADGIFKGGGTAGIAYVGALLALARNGIWFSRVAGNSAGAITAAIIAAGYNANDCDFLAAPHGLRSGAPAGVSDGAKPIDYVSLLDLPLSPGEVTKESRRRNLIYHAIEGPAIEEFLKLAVPLPGLDPFITQIVDQVLRVIPTKVGPFKAKVGPFKTHVPGIGNVHVGPFETEVGPFPLEIPALRHLIKEAVTAALKPYPTQLPLVHSGLLAVETVRQTLADAVMSVFLASPPWGPLLVIYLNFLGDGGLFKGDAFLKAMRHILESKIGKSPVLFSDLPMEFACLAADITAHKAQVFSRSTTPTVEVAEAVRRSMSIPFFFEPRRDAGDDVVDGGVMDNYPVGFFLATNNTFFQNTAADMARLKIGLSPGKLGMGPPEEVTKIVAELIPGATLPTDLVELEAINRFLNLAVTNMQHSPLLDALLDNYATQSNFVQIRIDSGHGATDFLINVAKFLDMTSKGWTAAIPIVQQILGPGASVDTTNPYSH